MCVCVSECLLFMCQTKKGVTKKIECSPSQINTKIETQTDSKVSACRILFIVAYFVWPHLHTHTHNVMHTAKQVLYLVLTRSHSSACVCVSVLYTVHFYC